MPRIKTTQPPPDEVFVSTGSIVEIRGHTSQIIKRGWDKEYLAQSTRDQALLGIIDDLQSNDPSRIKNIRAALQNNSTLARWLSFAGYDGHDRTLRNHAKIIRQTLELCLDAQDSCLPPSDQRKIRYILRPPK